MILLLLLLKKIWIKYDDIAAIVVADDDLGRSILAEEWSWMPAANERWLRFAVVAAVVLVTIIRLWLEKSGRWRRWRRSGRWWLIGCGVDDRHWRRPADGRRWRRTVAVAESCGEDDRRWRRVAAKMIGCFCCCCASGVDEDGSGVERQKGIALLPIVVSI